MVRVLGGTAAALKLFPISFLIYFVVRRRWRAAIACCAWIFALTATSVAVLGWDAYSDYRTIVVPSLSEFHPVEQCVDLSILAEECRDRR